MNLQQLLSSPGIDRLGWTLVHSLWELAAVALLLAFTLLLLRHRSPQSRYLAASAAMGLMLLAPVLTFWLMVIPPADQAKASTPIAPPATLHAEQLMQRPELPRDAVIPMPLEDYPRALTIPSPNNPPPAAQPEPSRATRDALQPALPYLVALWILGVAILSLWHAGGWLAAQRLKVLGTQPVPPEWRNRLDRLRARMRITRPVLLLASLLAPVPLVVGWLRPAILLPIALLNGLAPHQLEAILAHELAHIRRHDYLVNLLQTLAETLLFYHPAVWWTSRRMRHEREHCCDDIAASLCGDRSDYAEALAAMEETRLRLPSPAMAATGSNGAEFLSRIRRLLGMPQQPTRQGFRSAGAIALLLAMAGVAVWIGCAGQRQERTPAYTQANITMGMWQDDVRLPPDQATRIKLTDPRRIERLAEFFPQLDSGTNSRRAAGWMAGAVIEFIKPDGSVSRVTVSDNDDLTIWSAGRGDWPVKGDLAAFLDQLKLLRDHAGAPAAIPAPLPATRPAATQPADEDARYRALYLAYKSLILKPAQEGDRQRVDELTREFNESIGGRLRYVVVQKVEPSGKFDTLLLKALDSGYMAPAISHNAGDEIRLARVRDTVIVQKYLDEGLAIRLDLLDLPPTSRPAKSQRSGGQHLVRDPLAAIARVLPPDLVIQKVTENTYPFYLEEGKGRAIDIGLPPEVLARTPHKQSAKLSIWIMPPDYWGRYILDQPPMTGPPQKVASVPEANIFMWGDSEVGDRVLDALLTEAPEDQPTTRPADREAPAARRPMLAPLSAADRQGAKVELLLDKQEYFLGENILLHYHITNEGAAPFSFFLGGDGRNESGRALRFKVMAADARGSPADDPYPNPSDGGGAGGEVTLKPGEDFWEPLQLMRYREFTRDGAYTIKVYHDLGWDEPVERSSSAEKSTIPPGPHTAPTVTASLRVVMPNEQQARRIVEEMLKAPADPEGKWTRGRRGAPYGDFALLRYPVYLPIMKELAQKGDARALHAIGAMAFPEATAALLELTNHEDAAMAQQARDALWERAFGLSGGSDDNRMEYLSQRSWRDHLKPQAAKVGWTMLAMEDRDKQLRGAQMIESLGGKDDLPGLIAVMDELLVAGKDHPVERDSVSEALVEATGQLIDLGAAAPKSPDTPGQAVAFLVALRSHNGFRPPEWEAKAKNLLGHDIPFIRTLALSNMPRSLRNAPASQPATQPAMPAWEQFEALLDQPIDAPIVLQFTEKYGLKRYWKFDSGGFSKHGVMPFSLLYRGHIISRVVVTISHGPGSENRSPPYTGKLPFGVLPQDTPEDVIRRVGPPTHQPNRDYLRYAQHGLIFSFDRQTHQLLEIDLDAEREAPRPATRPATRPAAHEYLDRVSALLPKGWSARVKDDLLVIEREQEVRGISMVPSGPPLAEGEDPIKSYPLEIILRAGPRIAPEEYRRLSDENAAALKKWHADHQRTSDIPVSPRIKHALPTYFDDAHTVDLHCWELRPSWFGFGFSFESEDVATECRQVFTAIEGLFRKYAADAAPDAPR